MSENTRNAINWFEIPSANFQRAKKFYETILGAEFHAQKMGDCDMAFFPMDQGKVGGAVVFHEHAKPSPNGPMVYLNANPDLASVLDRVSTAGGKVQIPKTLITDEIGYFAVFYDSEGNRIALHSQK